MMLPPRRKRGNGRGFYGLLPELSRIPTSAYVRTTIEYDDGSMLTHYMRPAPKIFKNRGERWRQVGSYLVFRDELYDGLPALCAVIHMALQVPMLEVYGRNSYYSFKTRTLYVGYDEVGTRRLGAVLVRKDVLDECVPMTRIVHPSCFDSEVEVALSDGRTLVINNEDVELLSEKEMKAWRSNVLDEM